MAQLGQVILGALAHLIHSRINRTARRLAAAPPGVSPLPNAPVSGYRASATAKVAVYRGNLGLFAFFSPQEPCLTHMTRLALALLLALPSAALAQGYPAEKLLTTAETVMGEKIAYPLGDALVEAAIVTLAPGETTILHRHGVPFFAYILEGEITVD